MENYFQAFSIGSATGDLDDLGVAFGRFSLRVYVIGNIDGQDIVGYNGEVCVLNIEQVGYRYADEFNFKGYQPLGAWQYDLIAVQEPPQKFTLGRKNWFSLENETFNKFRKIKNLNLNPKNFLFYSRIKILNVPKDVNPSSDIPFYL